MKVWLYFSFSKVLQKMLPQLILGGELWSALGQLWVQIGRGVWECMGETAGGRKAEC